MRKFINKVIQLFIILGLLLVICNYAYINTEYYKNLNGMRKFQELPEHIDIVNFGASHSACAFNWSDYEEFDGANMALGSQTIVYDEAMLRYCFNHLDKDSTVVLEIMYKSLYEEEQNEPPYPTNITRYYQVLPGSYIKQWNLQDAIKYKYFPIVGNRQAAIPKMMGEWLYGNTGKSELERQQDMKQSLIGEPTQVLAGWEEDEMIAEGKRRAGVFMELSGNQVKGEQYDALIRMIEMCKENNIQVIMITAPTLPCFYMGYTKDFVDKFYADMDEICKKYEVQYIDYTGDERFLIDYRWYSDTDHLNGYGSEVFTRAFLEDHKNVLEFYK